MLDNPVTHSRRQKIDNGGVNFRRRRKRPAFLSIEGNNFHNLIGEFLLDAPVGFCFELSPLRNGSRSTVSASAVRYGKSSGQIAHLIHESPVRIGDVKSLHELQTRPARGRLIDSICLQTASISDDNKRTWYHGQSLTKQHWSRTTRRV